MSTDGRGSLYFYLLHVDLVLERNYLELRMPSHHERQALPYSPQQLFDMVADIERYPEFLPWCHSARILTRENNLLLAELRIGFKQLRESYVSRVALRRPDAPDAPGSIDVDLVRGPFEFLVNRWKFLPRPEGGTEVDFFLDFRFRSRLLEAMLGGLFAKATAQMGEAFAERAKQLYGSRK